MKDVLDRLLSGGTDDASLRPDHWAAGIDWLQTPLGAFPAPRDSLVPVSALVLPVDSVGPHLPDQQVFPRMLPVWFPLIGAVHNPVATDVDPFTGAK